MPGEIKIPGIGNVDKKYVIAGVLVGGGVAVVVVIRSRKAAAAAAQTTSATATGMVTDPAGNQCTALDTGSGYCPGTAGDQAYYAGQGGGGNTSDYGGYGGYGSGNSYDSGYDAAGYPTGSAADLQWQAQQSGTGTVTGTGSTTGTVTTNSDWLTEALGVLPGDTATVQTALASVLGGLTVTTAQKNLFMEAVGILGPPPQGYPTPIKTSDTAGHPSTGGGSGAKAAGAISNLQSSNVTKSGFSVHWNPAQGATGGYEYKVSELNGTVNKTANTKSTSFSIGGLHSGWTYNVAVQALPGGPGNNIHVKLP